MQKKYTPKKARLKLKHETVRTLAAASFAQIVVAPCPSLSESGCPGCDST